MTQDWDCPEKILTALSDAPDFSSTELGKEVLADALEITEEKNPARALAKCVDCFVYCATKAPSEKQFDYYNRSAARMALFLLLSVLNTKYERVK